MSAASPLVVTRDLTKTFTLGQNTIRAVEGLDFTLDSGDFVAVTGPSGSGKSTLLHLLGCLDRSTRGTYHLAGFDVSKLGDRALSRLRRTHIGFVFQTFHLIEELDVLGNVEMPFLYGDVPARSSRERALAAIEQVGLEERLRHRPTQLSGGEMQRVAIARALVGGPRLILADEPTGNLDSRTGDEILEVLENLNATGVTLVIVTHDADVAARARGRFEMLDGRLVRTQEVA